MHRAIRIHAPGGPDALTWEEVPSQPPGPGEVRIRHAAAGLNFIDVYHRTGLYPVPLPAVLGQEGAGRVVEVGPGVTSLKVNDRVAYAGLLGAYAEERVAPAERVVPLPPDISEETAAAMMLKGMAAEYLLRRTFEVKPGTTILFHAAAGGVGLIACAWAKALGATVIGTVGTEDKRELARGAGCDHVLLTTSAQWPEEIRALTHGRGVDVVYDGVGQATFAGSLEALRPRGTLVSFGQSSGKVPPLDVTLLSQKGSLFLTRPTLGHYTATREELLASAYALFGAVSSGAVRIDIRQRYALRDAAKAHRDLEARKTTGSTVLLP